MSQVVTGNNSLVAGYDPAISGWGVWINGVYSPPGFSWTDGTSILRTDLPQENKDELRKKIVIMLDDLPTDTMEQSQNKIIAKDLWEQLKPILFPSEPNKWTT